MHRIMAIEYNTVILERKNELLALSILDWNFCNPHRTTALNSIIYKVKNMFAPTTANSLVYASINKHFNVLKGKHLRADCGA